jgi:uncharacterized protein YeaO (DUF488 family)
MNIYTARIGHKGLDITVKSGDKTFAPSWNIVMDLKNGNITWEQYKEKYTQMMRKSYKQNTKRWLELINKDELTLICYCTDPNRCHRTLLADMLVKVAKRHGVTATYLGEK